MPKRVCVCVRPAVRGWLSVTPSQYDGEGAYCGLITASEVFSYFYYQKNTQSRHKDRQQEVWPILLGPRYNGCY